MKFNDMGKLNSFKNPVSLKMILVVLQLSTTKLIRVRLARQYVKTYLSVQLTNLDFS